MELVLYITKLGIFALMGATLGWRGIIYKDWEFWVILVGTALFSLL